MISVAPFHVSRLPTLERLDDLVFLLAYTEHDARLGNDLPALLPRCLLGAPQHAQTLLKVGTSVTHERRAPFDGLDIMRKDVKARRGDGGNVFEAAAKVGRQRLDEDVGCLLLDLANRRGNVSGAAIGKIVTVNRGEHNVTETPAGDGLGRVLGFVNVEWRWRTRRLDRAESAATRACVAHELPDNPVVSASRLYVNAGGR